MTKFVYVLLAVAVLLSTKLYAEGQVNNFSVEAVRADKTGRGYIKFNMPIAGTPAPCGISHPNHLSFDLNTPGGEGIMSIALAAQASNKKMVARGTGDCDIYSVVESWSWGYIVD